MILEVPDHLKHDFITFLDISAAYMDALDLTEAEQELVNFLQDFVEQEQGDYTELSDEVAQAVRDTA